MDRSEFEYALLERPARRLARDKPPTPNRTFEVFVAVAKQRRRIPVFPMTSPNSNFGKCRFHLGGCSIHRPSVLPGTTPQPHKGIQETT